MPHLHLAFTVQYVLLAEAIVHSCRLGFILVMLQMLNYSSCRVECDGSMITFLHCENFSERR